MFVTTTTTMENEKQTRSDAEMNLTRQLQTCEDRQEENIGLEELVFEIKGFISNKSDILCIVL